MTRGFDAKVVGCIKRGEVPGSVGEVEVKLD